MSEGVRLGAFGWGLHKVADPNGVSKRRPFVVVMESGGRFGVVFGRSNPPAGYHSVPVSHTSDLGRRMGLTKLTRFTASVQLLPTDYEILGYFTVELGDERLPDAVAEHDLWLEIRDLPYRQPA